MDYIDTSALIKGYLIEPGTPDFMNWFAADATPCVSPLSVVEFQCAIRRRERAGELLHKRAKAILSRLDEHLADTTISQLAWPANAFAHARDLLDRVSPLALRALDALHLAVALQHRCVGFATADRVQLEAARMLGLHAHSFIYPR